MIIGASAAAMSRTADSIASASGPGAATSVSRSGSSRAGTSSSIDITSHGIASTATPWRPDSARRSASSTAAGASATRSTRWAHFRNVRSVAA